MAILDAEAAATAIAEGSILIGAILKRTESTGEAQVN